MATNEKRLPNTETHEQILEMEEKIDAELSKGEQADMHLIDAYFRRIRELDGGIYEKSEEEVSRELNALYAKARRRQGRKRVGNSLYSVAQRAAAILILIGVFSGLSLGVYAAREPIVRFLSNTRDKCIEIFFDFKDVEKAPHEIETVYTLGSVPEGYELDSKTITHEHVEFSWKNENGASVKLEQHTLDVMSSVDNENVERSSFEIDGMQILYIEKFEYKSYYWNTNEYLFCMYIINDDDISAESGLDFIRSITEYQK